MPSKLPFPQWIPPQLTQLVETAPSGSKWLHEIKLDGFRMAGRIERGQARLLTRTGLDWSAKYPSALTALAAVRAKTAYLDGELCGVGEDGLSGGLSQSSDEAGFGFTSGAAPTQAPNPRQGRRAPCGDARRRDKRARV